MRARGKKFEMYTIKDQHLEIRFDSENSRFFAVFMDETYEDKDINTLKDILKDAVKDADTTVWTPVIRIEIETWRTHDAVFAIDKKLLGVNIVDGVVEKTLAAVHLPTGGDVEHYNNPKNWITTRPYQKIDEDCKDVRIIPYTIEKWKALELILEKMELLREKLREIIFSESGEHFLERLYADRDNVKLLDYEGKNGKQE